MAIKHTITLRFDPPTWEAFKEKCRYNRTSAVGEIERFMRAYNAGLVKLVTPDD